MRSVLHALLPLAVGCGKPSPSPPPPPPPVIAQAPAAPAPDAVPLPVFDDAAFTAWLELDDWTPLIDGGGFVVLTADGGQPAEIRRWCLPRGATYARYEALDLAAALISSRGTVRCNPLEPGSYDCGEATAAGRIHRFRVALRGERFQLAGVASFVGGAVTPADVQRYDLAIATPGTCP